MVRLSFSDNPWTSAAPPSHPCRSFGKVNEAADRHDHVVLVTTHPGLVTVYRIRVRAIHGHPERGNRPLGHCHPGVKLVESEVMKILPILAACLIFCPCAFARLGETLEQCTARYGKPLIQKDGRFAFRKADIGILIGLYKDKVYTIMYTKDIEGSNLSEAEMQALLDANGNNWKRSVADSGDPIWINGDKTRTASYLKKTDVLVIMDTKACEAVSELESIEEKKKLKGF